MIGSGRSFFNIGTSWKRNEKWVWLLFASSLKHLLSFLSLVASLLAYDVCFPQTGSSLCFGRIDWASASHFLAAVGDWVFIDQPSNFKLSNVPIVYYKMCIIFPQSGNAILTQNIYSLFVKSYYSRLPFCEKSLPNVRWNN